MRCTDPLRRGVGAPYQRPLGVGMGVKLNDTVLMGCTDPLRRGVGTPYQRPLGVGSKRPLARDADVRAFR